MDQAAGAVGAVCDVDRRLQSAALLGRAGGGAHLAVGGNADRPGAHGGALAATFGGRGFAAVAGVLRIDGQSIRQGNANRLRLFRPWGRDLRPHAGPRWNAVGGLPASDLDELPRPPESGYVTPISETVASLPPPARTSFSPRAGSWAGRAAHAPVPPPT